MVQIRKQIHDSFTSCRLFLKEQKEYCKWSRGKGELLYIDQYSQESKMRGKNLAMAWIGNKKTYDMVPLSRMINCLKIC